MSLAKFMTKPMHKHLPKMDSQKGKQLSNKIIALILILSPPLCTLYYAIQLPHDLIYYDYESTGLEYQLDPLEINIIYFGLQFLCYYFISSKGSRNSRFGFILMGFLSISYFFMLLRGVYPTMNYPLWGSVLAIIFVLVIWFPTLKKKLLTRK